MKDENKGIETMILTLDMQKSCDPMKLVSDLVKKANELGIEGKGLTGFGHKRNEETGDDVFDLKWKLKSKLVDMNGKAL